MFKPASTGNRGIFIDRLAWKQIGSPPAVDVLMHYDYLLITAGVTFTVRRHRLERMWIYSKAFRGIKMGRDFPIEVEALAGRLFCKVSNCLTVFQQEYVRCSQRRGSPGKVLSSRRSR